MMKFYVKIEGMDDRYYYYNEICGNNEYEVAAAAINLFKEETGDLGFYSIALSPMIKRKSYEVVLYDNLFQTQAGTIWLPADSLEDAIQKAIQFKTERCPFENTYSVVYAKLVGFDWEWLAPEGWY